MFFMNYRRCKNCYSVALFIAGISAVASLNAFADTNLLSSSAWSIVGTDDTGTNPRNISILIDEAAAGSFSELNFFYNVPNVGMTQVFSIKGNGTLQPLLAPPSEAGAVVSLVSYWDCQQGLIPSVEITELGWKSSAAGKPILDVRGKISNNNSLEATDFRMRFLPAETNSVIVELQFKLRATRDFCVDLTKHDTQEEFRVVTFLGNYISATEHDNDEARYVKHDNTNCGPFLDCGGKLSVCHLLTDVDGFLFDKPRRLADPKMRFVHRQASPRNTPTLLAFFRAPGRGRIKPQGFVTATADPAEKNVSFWGNWVDIKDSYKTQQSVGRFRFAIIAEPPRDFGCDKID